MAYTTKRTTNSDLNKPTRDGSGQALNKSNLKFSDSLKKKKIKGTRADAKTAAKRRT